MKIRVTVSTNYVGSQDETEIEVDDEATEGEIEQLALETMFDMIEWNWQKIEAKP